jgi:hypothetical protein
MAGCGEGLNQIGGVCAFADVVEVVRAATPPPANASPSLKNWTPPAMRERFTEVIVLRPNVDHRVDVAT